MTERRKLKEGILILLMNLLAVEEPYSLRVVSRPAKDTIGSIASQSM